MIVAVKNGNPEECGVSYGVCHVFKREGADCSPRKEVSQVVFCLSRTEMFHMIEGDSEEKMPVSVYFWVVSL